jgi:hypothetical protein
MHFNKIQVRLKVRELELLLEMKRILMLQGRDLDYTDTKRLDSIRIYLDNLDDSNSLTKNDEPTETLHPF